MSQSDFIMIREEFTRMVERIDMRLQALEGMFATFDRRVQNIEAWGQDMQKPPLRVESSAQQSAAGFNGPRVMRR